MGHLFAQEIETLGKKTDQESPTQEVIVEGRGATPAEAIKNAFRAAVQQVVLPVPLDGYLFSKTKGL